MRHLLAVLLLLGIMTTGAVAQTATPAPAKPPQASAAPAPAAPPAKAAFTPPQKTSEEFSYCTYKETAGEYTMLVYGWLAMWRVTEPYIPVVVALGRGGEPHKKGETKAEKKEGEESVVVTVENFQLTDAQGNVYSPVPYAEITAKYKFLLDDKNMLMGQPMVTTGAFPDAAPESLAFYPVEGGGRLAGAAAELDNYTAFESTIYFPKPAAGTAGILSLSVNNAKVDPISVKFKIPEEKEKKKKAGK